MRKTANNDAVSVKAYAGTTGVILAMNVEPAKRVGLLGFAIERLDRTSGRKGWLRGMLQFPGVTHRPGELVPSNVAPIQKFRWSDYAVYPETEYDYMIQPVYGAWNQPVLADGPTVTVKTASSRSGEHCVLFNRAAAASQAFSRRFPEVEQELEAARRENREPQLPEKALTWLSRGVLDQIVNFIQRAEDNTWALDIAIYEYELPAIVQAVNAAHGRGVTVRIVYHAKVGDEQTQVNESNLVGLPSTVKRARITNKICHHKFMVISRIAGGVRHPQAVLCGSTNFTENGVYRQANVVHVLELVPVAQQYLGLFEVLFRGDDPKATRTFINTNNQFLVPPQALFAGFSPRSGLVDLQAFIQEVQAARRDVLFCTAFDLYDGLEEALLGAPHDPTLRYGLQNRRSRITGFHADRTADFTATAMLSHGLEGWLKESTKGQRGNILIHTKIIIVDFTSEAPVVISGSHNFSKAASEGNDENFLVLRGKIDVADAYGCELMRLYDHYRFRFHQATWAKQGLADRPPTLSTNDTWTDAYFGGDPLKTSDRLRFAGEAI
jgi:phosphatidylserine/phosphatidylglycerophosphate/cardiolipin synthase-like enzyme